MHRSIAGRITTESGRGVGGLNVVFLSAKTASVSAEKYPPDLSQQVICRLGSATTEDDGRFAFQWDSGPVWAEGKEPLDLTREIPLVAEACQTVSIVVMPPLRAEEGQAPLWQTTLNGMAPEASEALSIEIPIATLQAAGAIRDQGATFAMVLEDDLKQQRSLAAALAKESGAQIAAAKEAASRGKKFVKGLSALPESVRKSPLFIGATEDISMAQRASEKDGLERIAINGGARVGLNFTDEFLRERGLEVETWTDRWTPQRIDDLCPLLGSRMRGPVLERVRSLFDVPSAEADPLAPADGDEPTGTTTPEPSVRTMEEEIADLVLSQIRPAPGEESGTDTAAVFERLKRAVAVLQTDGGLANATAAREVHSLQIAFPHIWTEAFDERFRETVANLYATTVELDEERALDTNWAGEAGDLRSLEGFLEEIDEAHRALEFSPAPPAVREEFPTVTFIQWNSLSLLQQGVVIVAVQAIRMHGRQSKQAAYSRKIVGDIVANPEGKLGRAQKLLLESRERLREPYAFHYFAPKSINYGILATYLQDLTPEGFQPGDPVATIPLAPGETRSITVTERLKRAMSRREVENALMRESDEVQRSQRAVDEILNRASLNSNFQSTASGSVNFGIGQIGGSAGFALNQAEESSRVKRAAREEIMRAGLEVRRDHTMEITTLEETAGERATTATFSNTNNEISVTYLLYELQRRYRVRERIHRLTPVIMVAFDVPSPHEIDDDWLVAWGHRFRAMLSRHHQETLEYMEKSLVGAELSLDIHRAHWNTQKQLVDQLKQSVHERSRAIERLQELLVRAARGADIERLDEPDDAERVAQAVFSGGLSLLFGSQNEDSERLEAERAALELRIEQLSESRAEMMRQLAREVSGLETATATVTKKTEAQFNWRARCDQLRVWTKQNILPVMQQIMRGEPPDQRFFRLYHQEVIVPQPSGCTIRRAREDEQGSRIFRREGDAYVIECQPPNPADAPRPLVEIADLDRMLGFKGNYMIFPLKECVYLTDFMMLSYMDDYFGLRDPDPLGEMSLDDLLTLRETRSSELDDESRDALEKLITKRLAGPRDQDDLLVVPTGHLFMEALPGTATLLEPFKRAHRALDVEMADRGRRSGNLEIIRYAKRLLEGKLEHPDSDHHAVGVRVERDGRT